VKPVLHSSWGLPSRLPLRWISKVRRSPQTGFGEVTCNIPDGWLLIRKLGSVAR
jgi:hypothetical protein